MTKIYKSDLNRYNLVEEWIKKENIKLNRGDVIDTLDNDTRTGRYFFDGQNLFYQEYEFRRVIPLKFSFPEFSLEYFSKITIEIFNFDLSKFKISEVRQYRAQELIFNLGSSKLYFPDSIIEYIILTYQGEDYYVLSSSLGNIQNLINKEYIQTRRVTNEDCVLINNPEVVNNHLFSTRYS